MGKQTKHSIDFISRKIGKQSIFSIPSDYFDGLEDDVLAKIRSEEFPEENGFTIPNNYLESFEESVLTKITKVKKETKVVLFKESLKNIILYGAVASLLLLVGFSYFYQSFTPVTFEDVSVADVETWFEDGYGISDDELAMALDDDNSSDEKFLTLEDDVIDEYINLIDDSNFINELEYNEL